MGSFAAMGNSNETKAPWPACLDNVVTVGAVDDNDSKASFSNYGSLLDMYAPGTDVDNVPWKENGVVQNKQGTSVSTPHAVGCAALLKSSGRYTTPDYIEARLKMSDTMITYGNELPVPRINCKPDPKAICADAPALTDCSTTPSDEDLKAVMENGSQADSLTWSFTTTA